MSLPCDSMQDQLADFVSGVLSEDLKVDLQKHINECPQCRAYLEALRQEDKELGALFADSRQETVRGLKRTIEAIRRSTQDTTQPTVRLVPDVPTDQADGVSRETRPIEQPPGRRHVPRRFIAMFQKKSVRWSAVAAAVVIAFVGVGSWKKLNNGKSGVVFADVLKNIQSARTVQFKGTSTVQVPGQGERIITTDTIITEQPNRMRQTVSMSGTGTPRGMVMIWDYSQGRCLSLDSQNKRAMVMEMSNMPAEQQSQNLIEQFRQLSDQAGTPIGEEEIAGRMTQGFKIVMGPAMEMLVWADPATQLPVQIETTMKVGIVPPISMTMTDFIWDQEVDESLVSMTPPDGYEVQTVQMNLGPANEQDVIEGLKTVAELNDGKFPASLDLMTVIKGSGKQLKTLNENDPAQRKEGEEAIVQLTTAISRAWMFINDPKNGDDFHYAGKDVAIGQPGIPVLWYQPKDSATYRVIDAGLTVRDVLPDDLPSVPSKLLRPTTEESDPPPQQ